MSASRFSMQDNDQAIRLHTYESGPIVTVRGDGTIELGEGVSLDDAARAFWERVSGLQKFYYGMEQIVRDLAAVANYDVAGGGDELDAWCALCGRSFTDSR